VIDSDLPTYAAISPVRDEAEHFSRMARSMVAQTHRPRQWIIVDDGSTDGTRAIAESFAARHDWITVIGSGRGHSRARGGPIVRAFETGRGQVSSRPAITVKLDGDLFLPSHYFEWVAATFARSPRAGIVGGVAMVHDGTRWRADGDATHHVNGVAKAYSTDCLDDIGGLQPSMGWDGIDEYSAKARGWEVHVLTELSVLHYRLRGSKQPFWRSRWEEGRGNHFMGYTASFLAVRAVYRMAVERPPVLGGLVLGAGFAWARLARAPQVDDPEAIAALRLEQRRRLRGLAKGRTSVTPEPPPGGGPAFWA
jgi:hypothetical protein